MCEGFERTKTFLYSNVSGYFTQSMTDKETSLDKPIGGLFMMIIFTIIWIVLAEWYFNNYDYRIAGGVLGIGVSYLIYNYWIFNKKKTSLPKTEQVKNPKKERLLWIIFAIEGIGIFLTINFLINFKKENLLISSLALIVGLHFIPLAKVFDKKFHFYIGIWTTFVAVLALFLIVQNSYNYKIVNAFLCCACAISTTLCGQHIINTMERKY